MKKTPKILNLENKENFVNYNKEKYFNIFKENINKIKKSTDTILKNKTNMMKKNSKKIKSNLRIKKLKKRKIYFKSSRYPKNMKFDCFIDEVKISFGEKNLKKLISQVK